MEPKKQGPLKLSITDAAIHWAGRGHNLVYDTKELMLVLKGRWQAANEDRNYKVVQRSGGMTHLRVLFTKAESRCIELRAPP